MLKFEQVWLEDITMSVKTDRAQMRFSLASDCLLPEDIRKVLRRMKGDKSSLMVRMIDESGEVRLEVQAILKTAVMKVGDGGVLSFQVEGLSNVFAKLNELHFLAQSASQVVKLYIAEEQRTMW